MVALILIAVGNGCSSTTTIVRQRTLTVDEIVQMVHHRDAQITTLKGEGSITFESPEASSSGAFEVYVKKPDSLRLELKGPFGVHVGTLTLSEKEYLFYNWRNNTATHGSSMGAPFASLINLTLRADEIVRAFTGEFLHDPTLDSLTSFLMQNELYVLRYRSERGAKEYRIDPQAMSVASYRLIDSLGNPQLIAIASRFDDERIPSVPRLLRVIEPKERRSVTISYGEVTLNEPVRCSFILPQHADIINR